MFKAAVILSLVLNLLFVGVVGAIYFMRPDDSKFVMDYMKLEPDQRKAVRDSNDTIRRMDIAGQEQFEELLLNQDFRDRFGTLDSPEQVQQLLVEATRTAIANQNRRMAEEQAAVERFRMRMGEYRDFESNLTEREAAVAADRETLDRERKEWESLQLMAHLNQLVEDINKADKFDAIAPRVAGLPTIQQAYVLRTVTVPEARTAIIAALPAEEQSALKAFNSRQSSNDLGTLIGASR